MSAVFRRGDWKGLVAVRSLFCALLMLLAATAAAEAAPRRVVSLDYCADQFVLALADRDQIAAVSRGAGRDDSYFRDRAQGLRRTRGTLEEVLALDPDLIVRTWGGPWDADVVYGRFGAPVLQLGDAANFAEARAQVLRAADTLGHPARGAAIVADLDHRLAALRTQSPPARAPMMYLSSAGAVAGAGTMMDAVIDAAGGRNVWQGESWTVLPLERMIETPPALIALGFFDTGRERMNAWSRTRHPVLQRALAHTNTVSLPAAAVSCEAWYAIDAAETLARARAGR